MRAVGAGNALQRKAMPVVHDEGVLGLEVGLEQGAALDLLNGIDAVFVDNINYMLYSVCISIE